MRAILIGFAILISGCNAESSQKSEFHVRAESIIRKLAKDPESVQFEETFWVKSPLIICGSFNAKNSFGGYTGSTRYVYNGREMQIDGYTPDFSVKWIDCIGAKPIYED